MKICLANRPTLPMVLQTLRDATGLTFTVADSLQTHDPDFGQVQLRNAPAWVVMSWVTEYQMRDGRWEPTDNGYQLNGLSLAPQRPTTNFLVVVLVWLLPGLAILGLTSLYLRWRRAAALTPAPPTDTSKPSA